ncbi:DUF6233 domain-containing protein [Streptomyces sp. NPDC051555]|uniref:DUF6233 domain-containing protein n=1 Tax=Streptomyces sp. NPDC051555 TaxID=3365657 RepID=UPI00378B1E7E
MTVLPPDADRLRTVVTYLRAELTRAERALLVAEQEEETAARRRTPREPPAWLVEHGIGVGRPPTQVHAGDCWATGKRCVPATAEQLRELLARGVPGCIHCRPDTALGVLE